MFEGLGLGTRLAFLQLGESKQWIKYTGAIVYSMDGHPLGHVRSVWACAKALPLQAKGAAISGKLLLCWLRLHAHSLQLASLDSISAGILLYTATVELIARTSLLCLPMMLAETARRICFQRLLSQMQLDAVDICTGLLVSLPFNLEQQMTNTT